MPARTRRGRGWLTYLIGFVGLGVLIGGPVLYFANRPAAARPDVLTHKVKRETLNITVVEKGTLESAENADITCKVRAGSKGFASTINWVIEDGAKVKAGQLLMILDDSALQDQYRDQKIVVDSAEAAKVKAEKDYEIAIKRNEQLVAVARNTLSLAEIDLEKFTGLDYDNSRAGLGAAVGVIAALSESGSFQQEFDDLSGQVRLADSEVEQNRERAAWADRMVKMKYMSQAQATAEKSRLDSSLEKSRGLQAKLKQLATYDRKQRLTDFRSKVNNAKLELDKALLVSDAEKAQAFQERTTKRSIYNQEREKLHDIAAQIKECKITAPQAGMVVYFKNESSRFSSSQQGLIEQGAQVKEGQKMLRIPNLDVMQVNTKVHEAMVGRIKGDVRVSTGLVDKFRAGLLAAPDPFARAVSQQDGFQEMVREQFRDQEYRTTRLGQRATIRVDSLPDRILPARVKSVAAVASQSDSWVSDVKLFPTLVLIEEKVEGLKPDGTAEVTIHVNGVEDVLAVPVQAVVGGTEMGATRKVFVKNNTGGFDEKEIVLGIYNEKMVEVRSGLSEGDEVVINPKVLLGDAATKTRDGGDSKGGGGEGKGKGGSKGGSDPASGENQQKKGKRPTGEGGGAPSGGGKQ